MTTIDNEIQPKLSFKYYCKKCDYGTCKKSNMDSHMRSAKHLKTTDNNEIQPKLSQTYICQHCDKIFNDRAGLWRHKKKCNTENKIIINDDTNKSYELVDKDLIMLLIKENSELKNIMLEVIKTGTHNNNNNNNTINNNSHNKAFNLNFFLNETCKNAMNINDFIDSIQLNLSDLERVGDMGFVKGISDIIIKNLNALDVTERPIHCTDKKREVLYVKDEDKWEKEDPDNGKVRKVIKKVASKNSKILKDFKEKHPDCTQSVSRFADRYNKLIIEAFGGIGNDFRDNENKIIRNISKAVTIDKE